MTDNLNGEARRITKRSPISRRGMVLGTVGSVAGIGLASPALANPSESNARRPASPKKAPNQNCILETGAALLYVKGKPTIVHDASIRIRGDRVVEVSAGRIRGTAPRVDLRSQLVLPGFISGHTHVSVGSYTRAVIEGGGGTQMPHDVIEAMDDSAIDALMAFNLLELLRTGVTTVVNQDHNVRRAYSYVRVASRWGARGYPSGMIPGVQRLMPIWRRTNDQVLFDSVPETLKEIEANLKFGLRFNGSEDGRILPNMAPHATDTHTDVTMAAVLAAAKKLGNGVHLHLSQSAQETERVRKLWGVTPTQWLEQLGFFEERVFGAHMSGLDLATDLPILARHKAFFATCPSGGGPGGTPQPWPEALAAGVPSGPAIDTHSNDMVENVKMAVIHGQARAALLANSSEVPLKKPTIEDAVNGATHVAATALGRDDLGRIEVGAKADLVSVDVTSPVIGSGAMSPRPLWNLLYSSGSQVENVITDGNFQVYNGRFMVDDEARIVREGGKVVREMYGELLARGYFG